MEQELNIINFAYFTANFPSGFINQVWEGNQHIIDHLTEKILSLRTQGVVTKGVFMTWFLELDRPNQVRLVKWVNENYHGVIF